MRQRTQFGGTNADDNGSFFRPTEQQLLAYALISVVQGEIRQVDRVHVFLMQEARSLSGMFKGLQAHADAFASLSPPRLMHTQWGVSKSLKLQLNSTGVNS